MSHCFTSYRVEGVKDLIEDKLIINLYLDRDEKAIRYTDVKYRSYCFSISNNIIGDMQSAEECVNDTWLEAWNSIPPQRPNVLKLFLAKTTRNISLDYFRKMKAKKRGEGQIPLILDELSEVISSDFDLENELMYRELLGVLNCFLKNLSDEDRTIFLQRYFYAMSIKEIASNSNYKYNNLVVKFHRLREKLKSMIESEVNYDKGK